MYFTVHKIGVDSIELNKRNKGRKQKSIKKITMESRNWWQHLMGFNGSEIDPLNI